MTLTPVASLFSLQIPRDYLLNCRFTHLEEGDPVSYRELGVDNDGQGDYTSFIDSCAQDLLKVRLLARSHVNRTLFFFSPRSLARNFEVGAARRRSTASRHRTKKSATVIHFVCGEARRKSPPIPTKSFSVFCANGTCGTWTSRDGASSKPSTNTRKYSSTAFIRWRLIQREITPC